MIDSVRYKGFDADSMREWKLVYKNAKSKCNAPLAKEESSEDESDEETQKHKSVGPKKCLVQFDEDAVDV